MSRATVYRRYRPIDAAGRTAATKLLDVRVRPGDRALHCCTASVNAERDRLLQEVFEGYHATDSLITAGDVGTVRRPTCQACGERAATVRASYCYACGKPYAL
jgi:hypothetical protein